MSATGMPDGDYRLGELTVRSPTAAPPPKATLAGSVLTLDRALANFLRFTGATLEHGLRLLTTNPAALIRPLGSPGFTSSAGHLAPGLPANFVAVNPDGTLAASFLQGHLVA
jgi:N-acetylglucosamine-6-phosphate deacetylase